MVEVGAELRNMLGSPLAELQCVGAACRALLLRSSFAWTGAVFKGHEGPLSETFTQMLQVGVAAFSQTQPNSCMRHQGHLCVAVATSSCLANPCALLCKAASHFITATDQQLVALVLPVANSFNGIFWWISCQSVKRVLINTLKQSAPRQHCWVHSQLWAASI